MYQVRLAKLDEIYEIVNDKGFTFDLNIEFKPKFYVLIKDDMMISFAFINFCDEYAIIEHLSCNSLNDEEIDFFIRSLNYTLSVKYTKIFTREYFKDFTIPTSHEDLFVLDVKTCKGCKHG
ncbi:hypothetical protein [Microaceticoccus formicicus]|uniref:hypothetical protein n=1 Tax=Microaceticoccus formicicus TaxID=3118105 RepID=UPI003CD0126D|nr:hypothetical protein VZL98_05610 [Peptoniphilaceae bacterium AMB_02]